jgi:hypothetical protein
MLPAAHFASNDIETRKPVEAGRFAVSALRQVRDTFL